MTDIFYFNLLRSENRYLLNWRVLSNDEDYRHCLLFSLISPCDANPYIIAYSDKLANGYLFKFRDDIKNWLLETCPSRYFEWPRYSVILFKDESDAMITKLRWA